MKKGKMKKLMALAAAGMMVLTGCNTGGTQAVDSTNEDIFTIGISQLTEHPALDDARRGFEDGLQELGVNAEIVYQNAQGDIPNTVSISQKFVKDEVDLIYAIATPAAQSAKQATSEIPIIFSAVTDPVAAELVDSMEVPGKNITGTSDATPMDRQLQLFKDLDENIKNIGIIFNTSEPNSHVQVDAAKELSKEFGLEIVEVGITSINDIPQAVDSIIDKVDAIYTITDNMVASAINVVAEKALDKNMITVAAEGSHLAGGILITDGISYYEIGKQSARMAKEILVDGKNPSEVPAETALNTSKVFNEDTLKALGLDINNKAFKDAEKFEQ
ncbi:ABC transporter substrate-binding protein [Tissierella sp. Yu-01]|uniref:ABC transporter substrate-binding protein n=1 Tax=Tissierella sp. Yu-01 TaxID=3035694 RepID=UPI00240DE2F4|nr:ABC transporter substrate-binding protein [Tissierella sp. Yu-01]WFA09095.1 ABC transporter substrate-binding protein [Tissierella sp. Yu-01]